MRETQAIGDFGKAALTHMDSLWQTALWFTKNDHEAENLIISVYVEASACWEGLLVKDDCKIWMFKILVKKLLESIHLNYRAQFSGYIDHPRDVPLENSINALELIPPKLINNAIKSLPAENRLVIVLSIYGKFTYSQIAEIIGVHRIIISSKIQQGYFLMHKEIFKHVTSISK
jgi:RNA polymerase sigma-70 factor, ECF subfamily